MPSVFDRLLSALAPDYAGLRAEVNALKAQGEHLMVKQEDVDAKFDALFTAISNIAKDIAEIKAAVPPGTVMSDENFAKLSAVSDAAAALDAENPAAPTT